MPNQQILEFIDTISVPAISRFVAAEKFVVTDSPVRIIWIDASFRNGLLGKTEELVAETVLGYAELIRAEFDDPILKELGDHSETALAAIYALMERQPGGEEGVLLTNGWTNIFYARDTKNELRAVSVRWRGGGWEVHATSVKSPFRWSAGYRVFSRNSY